MEAGREGNINIIILHRWCVWKHEGNEDRRSPETKIALETTLPALMYRFCWQTGSQTVRPFVRLGVSYQRFRSVEGGIDSRIGKATKPAPMIKPPRNEADCWQQFFCHVKWHETSPTRYNLSLRSDAFVSCVVTLLEMFQYNNSAPPKWCQSQITLNTKYT